MGDAMDVTDYNNGSSDATVLETALVPAFDNSTVANKTHNWSTTGPADLHPAPLWSFFVVIISMIVFFVLFVLFMRWFMKREDPNEGKEEIKIQGPGERQQKCVIDHHKSMKDRMEKLRTGQIRVPGTVGAGGGGVAATAPPDPVASHPKRSSSKGSTAAAGHVPHHHSSHAAPLVDPSHPVTPHTGHTGSGHHASMPATRTASAGRERQVSPSRSSSRPSHASQQESAVTANQTIDPSGVMQRRRSSSRPSAPSPTVMPATAVGHEGSHTGHRHGSRDRLV